MKTVAFILSAVSTSSAQDPGQSTQLGVHSAEKQACFDSGCVGKAIMVNNVCQCGDSAPEGASAPKEDSAEKRGCGPGGMRGCVGQATTLMTPKEDSAVLLLCEVNVPPENATKMDDIWQEVIDIVADRRVEEHVRFYTVGRDPEDPSKTFLREVEQDVAGFAQHLVDTGDQGGQIAKKERALGAYVTGVLGDGQGPWLSILTKDATAVPDPVQPRTAQFQQGSWSIFSQDPDSAFDFPELLTVNAFWTGDEACLNDAALKIADVTRGTDGALGYRWAWNANGEAFFDEMWASADAFMQRDEQVVEQRNAMWNNCGSLKKMWYMGTASQIATLKEVAFPCGQVECAFYVIDPRSISCNGASSRCNTPQGERLCAYPPCDFSRLVLV